jgi:hypothetical protein
MKKGHQLFSAVLNTRDTKALERMAKREDVSKSALFREWIRASDNEWKLNNGEARIVKWKAE